LQRIRAGYDDALTTAATLETTLQRNAGVNAITASAGGRDASPHRRALALFGALATTGCLVPPHDDFTSPQDAVLTFQSRFARDDVAGEVGCFSQEFRAQNGVSLPVYATVRDRLLEPLGVLGRFVLRRNSLEDNLAGGDVGVHGVQLVYSLAGHAFEVTAVPETVFRFPDPTGGEPFTPALAADRCRIERDQDAAADRIVVVVQVPEAAARAMLEHGLPWAELENQWRLEMLRPLGELPAVAPLPERSHGGTRALPVPALRVVLLFTAFGAAQMRVELPLAGATGCVRELPGGGIRIGALRSADSPDARIDRLRWEVAPDAAR